MLKRNLVRAFVLMVIVVVAHTDGFADIRVQFRPGRTSATLTGSLASRAVVCFVARAREGQTLNASVGSENGKVSFLDLNDSNYTEYLKFTGDHRVCINNGGRFTNYRITISIR